VPFPVRGVRDCEEVRTSAEIDRDVALNLHLEMPKHALVVMQSITAAIFWTATE
jgi:hypothetical protein